MRRWSNTQIEADLSEVPNHELQPPDLQLVTCMPGFISVRSNHIRTDLIGKVVVLCCGFASFQRPDAILDHVYHTNA